MSDNQAIKRAGREIRPQSVSRIDYVNYRYL
jgi:hypothetical protein